uniref:Eukaryotic translation initiation factor 3 subunit K n=1 Tax=Kalanchoe fedtschenkoi TaxID=63787 RepID=A0A7N0RFT6_KALFE
MGREEQQQVSLTVEQLVAVNPYNPDILNDLEDFVNEQVSSKTYNLEANLCLLRLYQFEPEKMKTLFVANILLKVNFLLNTCKFLMGQQMEDQFKTLIVLSHYLETARFSQFWEETTKNRHVLETVPGKLI